MKAKLTIDLLKHDSKVLDGPITRAGAFEYDDGIYYKDWDNLVDQFSKTKYLPVIGSKNDDSHLDIDDRIIGFAHNFTANEETKQVYADVHLFDDIENLSDLYRPENLPVSIGFEDSSNSDIQNIERIHHLAMSLNASELDRCSTAGGMPCRVSIKKTDSVNVERSSSQETDGTRKIIKQLKGDSMKIKKEKESEKEAEITEDTTTEDAASKPATPDNLGSETWNVEQNTKSARKAFMLDCQKYGPYGESQCAEAWSALQGSPASPKKANDKSQESSMKESKDFIALKSEVNELKSVLTDFAKVIPTLTEVVNDKNKEKMQEMVLMREDLAERGFCEDMLENIKDYDDLRKFYNRVATNQNIFKEDTADEIRNVNTSKLLGKRKKNDKQDFEDMISKAKSDSMKRFYPKQHNQQEQINMLKNLLGGA